MIEFPTEELRSLNERRVELTQAAERFIREQKKDSSGVV